MCHLEELAEGMERDTSALEAGRKARASVDNSFWAFLTRDKETLTMTHGPLPGRSHPLGKSPMSPEDLQGYSDQESGKKCKILCSRSMARYAKMTTYAWRTYEA